MRPGVPEASVELAETEANDNGAVVAPGVVTLATGVVVVIGGFSAGSCPAPITGTAAGASRFLTILFKLTWSLRAD